MIAILVPHKQSAGLVSWSSLFLISLVALSCGELNQKETRQVNEALNDSLTSTTETWDLNLRIIEDGLKKIRLQGSYAATFNTDDINETRIQGPVSIAVFDSTSSVKTWVDSDSAIYRAEDAEFEFFGDVRVHTRDNRTLKTEHLIWNQAENNISTSDFVIITTPTDSIAGTGFTGASDLSNYTIKEPSGHFTFE